MSLEAILRDQGWEPESNICRCGHLGGDHSSWGNRCLICEDDIFSSFSEKELWANAIAALEAAGVTRATPDAGGVFWDERAHEIGSDPALSDFQKVNALLRLIDATLAPTPPDALREALEIIAASPFPAMSTDAIGITARNIARLALRPTSEPGRLWREAAVALATPAPLDDGLTQRAHVVCCWCGEHHEEGD